MLHKWLQRYHSRIRTLRSSLVFILNTKIAELMNKEKYVDECSVTEWVIDELINKKEICFHRKEMPFICILLTITIALSNTVR